MKYLRKTLPWVPAGHPDFKWTSGADVQARWKRHGWAPPSERMAGPVYVEVVSDYDWRQQVRRIK